MRRASLHSILLIMGFEGFRPTPYYCFGGVLTIGYGTTSGITSNMRVTHDEAVKLLMADVSNIDRFLNKEILIPLNQNQHDALVSFIYNIGERRFKESTMLKLLNEGKIEDASMQFTKWSFVRKVWNRGLYRRRVAEKALFDKL